MAPIKTHLLLAISFFPCASACADRCTSGTVCGTFEINILYFKVLSNVQILRKMFLNVILCFLCEPLLRLGHIL